MSEILAHHGILGMKWGVRRTPEQLGNQSAPKKAKRTLEQKQSEDAKRYDYANRGTHSDAELRQKIERLKMEKELRELTMQELSPGKAFVNQVMKEAGKRAATTALTGAMLYGTKAAIGKEFNRKDFASAVFNGGPKKK